MIGDSFSLLARNRLFVCFVVRGLFKDSLVPKKKSLTSLLMRHDVINVSSKRG